MFADCGAAATTKLERLQNAHVDQHIYKTFKMLQNGVLVLGGSSGPGGLFWVLPIWSCFCFYKSVKVLRHLCRSEDRLPEPEPIRARPPPQAPQETPPPGATSRARCTERSSVSKKEKKRSFVLQVSIVQHLNTKVKKAPYGGGANTHMGREGGKYPNGRGANQNFGSVTMVPGSVSLLIYLHCCPPPPPNIYIRPLKQYMTPSPPSGPAEIHKSPTQV